MLNLIFSCIIDAMISGTDGTMARRRFIAPLSDSEQQTLTSAYQDGEKRALRRRAHAILLSNQGHTINKISGSSRCRITMAQAMGSVGP